MLELTAINIENTYNFDYWTVSWTIEDTVENVSNFTFDIFRATSSEGPWLRIASGVTTFSYNDTDINFYKPSLAYYYKVEIQDTYSQERVLQDIVGKVIYREPDNIAMCVQENERIYLENVVKNPLINILVKIRSGTLCTCWDEYRKQITDELCPLCYGTKYTGGYNEPVPVEYCMLSGRSTLEQNVVMSDVDDENNSQTQLWIQNAVIVQPDDIVVDTLNNRYHVKQVLPTTKNWYVLRQIITVQILPKSDPVYLFPIGG